MLYFGMRKFIHRVKTFLRIFIPIIVPNRILAFYSSKIVRDYNKLSDGEVEFFLLINDSVRTIIDVGPRTAPFYALHKPNFSDYARGEFSRHLGLSSLVKVK